MADWLIAVCAVGGVVAYFVIGTIVGALWVKRWPHIEDIVGVMILFWPLAAPVGVMIRLYEAISGTRLRL